MPFSPSTRLPIRLFPVTIPSYLLIPSLFSAEITRIRDPTAQVIYHLAHFALTVKSVPSFRLHRSMVRLPGRRRSWAPHTCHSLHRDVSCMENKVQQVKLCELCVTFLTVRGCRLLFCLPYRRGITQLVHGGPSTRLRARF